MDQREHPADKPHADAPHKKKLIEVGKTGLKVSKKLIFVGIAAIALVVIVAASIPFLFQGQKVESVKTELEPQAPPENFDGLELIEIVKSDCKDCFDLGQLTSVLKQLKVKISGEKRIEFDSEEGKSLIKQFAVENVPNLIIKGDVSSNADLAAGLQQIGKISPDGKSFVLTKPLPVFYNLKEQKEFGKVDAILLMDSKCKQCQDYGKVLGSLKAQGVKFTSTEVVDASSEGGQKLISKYGIGRIPTLLFSSEAKHYDTLVSAFQQVASQENDGWFVMRTTMPPYVNVSSGTVMGLVAMTKLVDSSCKECYDASLHENLLGSYGLVFSNISEVDISSRDGKQLISKYNITLVPTILLSSDAQSYPFFDQVWSQVGSVELDGNLVFRNLELLENATIKNLATGKVMTLSIKSGQADAVENASGNAATPQNATGNPTPGTQG